MRKIESELSKKRIEFKRRKIERLRRKSLFKKKRRNQINNSIRISFSEPNHTRSAPFPAVTNVIISANSNLTLLEHTDNVLSLIKDIEDATAYQSVRLVVLDLTIVVKIDIGCISILLSKITKLTQNNVHTICNLPNNPECKKMFFESGFSDHMRDLQGRKILYSKINHNLMVNRGFDKTSNEKVGLAIRKSVEHLTGLEQSYRPLYSIAQEMCANSIEHANEYNKNWLFSVWYKDEENVCFTMTDLGSGILGTLKRKFSQVIKELLLRDNKEILIRAFEKKYSSATKDINRNKGLPKIKNISDSSFINNLVVITNNVLLNFSDLEKSRRLYRKFNGTFYYWELNKNCIEIWKNRQRL